MKIFPPEQYEQEACIFEAAVMVNDKMLALEPDLVVTLHRATNARRAALLRQAAAQARVIAGMEAWCQKHHYDDVWHADHASDELHRLLTEHGLTPPKDQP